MLEDGFAIVYLLLVRRDRILGNYEGIILRLHRCGDRKGHFRRVGYFFGDPQCYEQFAAALKEPGALAAESECREVNNEYPETPYIITIE